MSAYPDDGELVLELDGGKISGWQQIRITRGIERCPSDFEISLTEKYPGSAAEVFVAAGQVCRVRIGGDLVLTGYVDRYGCMLSADSHTVVIKGRSACEDIVDSSVLWRNFVINSTNLTDVARKLCEPYGISVSALAGNGPTIPQLTLNLGETPYQVIERVARYAAMLAYDDVQGNLVLATVGAEKMASGFKQGLNVLSASVEFGVDQRFSEYNGYIQSTDSLSDMHRSDSVEGNLQATVVDPGMKALSRIDGAPRRRVMAIISEQVDQQGLYVKRRATWEMARRFGRSQALRVEADSWRDTAGKLWEPNHRATVDIPACKVTDAEWVIGEVSYVRDDRGTRADLLLMPPQAFDPEPAILNPFAGLFQVETARDGRRDQG